ncbi:MAG: hypothetical protein IT370_22515 [Deltaproteobacteria bacterium]|nr:hypothetical protein [Deltaproteobacteria bacterium]
MTARRAPLRAPAVTARRAPLRAPAAKAGRAPLRAPAATARRAPMLALAALLAHAGCADSGDDLALAIRLPADTTRLGAVSQLNLSARRGDVVLAQASFAAGTTRLALAGVSFGASTVVRLDGVDAAGAVIATGRTCPIDFQTSGMSAPLYLAPTNFFAPTAGAPLVQRTRPVAAALSDGTVAILGGADSTTVELMTPGAASFTALPSSLGQARRQAEAVTLTGAGVLVVGGVSASGDAIAGGELLLESQRTLVPVTDPRLDARVGHRVVELSEGRAFVSGGAASTSGAPLSTTVLVRVFSDGTYQLSDGVPLAEARREHAVVVAAGTAMLFGGRGAGDLVLDSVEAFDPTTGATSAAAPIAHLATARAGATASVLPDNSGILLTGGQGSDGKPLASAEVFNLVTRTTTTFTMAAARRGHTATVLDDGRVLIAGGFDAAGNPLRSVEIFTSGVGFVSEIDLGSARGDHAALSLCDGTVLLVGGAATAELYTP